MEKAWQLLSGPEEKALKGWIVHLTATWHTATYQFIKEMASISFLKKILYCLHHPMKPMIMSCSLALDPMDTPCCCYCVINVFNLLISVNVLIYA